jgi:hypothetical protein
MGRLALVRRSRGGRANRMHLAVVAGHPPGNLTSLGHGHRRAGLLQQHGGGEPGDPATQHGHVDLRLIPVMRREARRRRRRHPVGDVPSSPSMRLSQLARRCGASEPRLVSTAAGGPTDPPSPAPALAERQPGRSLREPRGNRGPVDRRWFRAATCAIRARANTPPVTSTRVTKTIQMASINTSSTHSFMDFRAAQPRMRRSREAATRLSVWAGEPLVIICASTSRRGCCGPLGSSGG